MAIRINFRRVAKSSVPIACYTLFAILLTFYLFDKPVPLGNLQHLGWQAFDIVSFSNVTSPSGSKGSAVPQKNETDWWDVDNDTSDTVGPTSFRLDVWNPLLPHRTGLTEIEIKPCLFPPVLFRFCDPRTTPEDDALKGPWVRVDNDLNAKTGRWYLSIWYRRSRRLDVPLITSLLVLEDGQEDLLPEPKGWWHKAAGSLHDGVRPGGSTTGAYLWYKLQPPALDESEEEEVKEVITEIDVHFGDDRPFFGFERVKPEVFKGDDKLESVSIVYRRGVQTPPKPKPLHFSHSGNFKILQIADLHFSVSRGACRDTDHKPCEHGDTETASLLSTVLDAEKPDLVVFTGDQLNGQGTSWDSKSVLAKFAQTVIERNISWAAVFGNHDTQGNLGRVEEMQLLQALPFSLSQAGPSEVDGVGNYVLKVFSPDASKTHILTLYFLDSGAYVNQGWQWWKPPEYDWIKPSQREWFLEESKKIMPIERPFSPDGAKDLAGIDILDDDKRDFPVADTRQQTSLAKPNALMFFHIPLPEAYFQPDRDTDSPSRFDIGSQLDGNGAAKTNGIFFEDALLRARESEAPSAPAEVKVVGNGHCHLTDRCRRITGVWMCFGGGGSYSGYGKIGFDRRFRIYDIKDFGETIESYKRTEHGEIMDRQVLAGKGAPRR